MAGRLWRRGVVVGGVVLAMVLSVGGVALAAAPLRLMVVGDSISQGSSGDVTWRYQLHQHLARSGVSFDLVGDRTDLYNNITNQHGDQSYPYAFDRDHHALWGRALAQEKDTIQAAVAGNGADVVLVLLGINDVIWFSHSAAQIADNMRAFVTNARAANPAVTVVIGHTLSRWDPFARTYLNVAQTADINGRYDALAAAMSTSTSRVVSTANPPGWDPAVHTWDGTHPSSTGEARIAAAFANALSGVGVGAAYSGPVDVTWPWAGPAVSATSLDRAVRLSWSATPGANAYVVEQRNIKPLNEAGFTRLPIPIEGTTWTTQGLAGMEVDYRLVPSKGLMEGLPGGHTRALYGGAAPGPVTLDGAPGSTDNTARLWWSSTPNATGYYIEAIDLARGPDTWTRLPLPVTATSFDPGLLYAGSWYRWRIVPVNGLLEGPPSSPIEIRTTGAPYYTRFFALGDSFSAGTGNLNSMYEACYRSPTAWPYMARAPWEPATELLACAAATVADVRASQLGQIPWHGQGPTLVTMTIGGNDAGFVDELLNCVIGATSCTTREAALATRIDGLYSRLRTLYRDIRLRAPGADIFVAGYPQLVAPQGSCSILLGGLDEAEREMIGRLGARLNIVIQAAATAAGVVAFTTNVTTRFSGSLHAACGTEPWINNLVIGYEISSFHPHEAGNLGYALALNDSRILLNTTGAVREAP
ncbi:GDSL-type esterase/lipase family protein [Phytohabitans rumicis]|uniref:Fibronectin type-III domain-containing protein n=1 Tax=Phytohabitans rumicis TaxID=1076125 RepID=A0A6V8LFT7_9ACTN|nr:GDSL-type esterase/lipase family protein [Phytohabitans rumicis]GFJ95174.1 hypothetical protein Prum_088160 [Phytohabitans rumicis]